jgi:ferric-dicitrate binding protein FerR (iron transport regulator)
MAISRKHIDQVFDQRFTLLDHKMLEKYFEDNDLNEETKLVLKEQWERFATDPDNPPNLDHIFYKLYYTINNQKDLTIANGRGMYLNIFRIAAIFIMGLLLTMSILIFSNSHRAEKDQQLEFISQTGFRNQFRLPDGTTGWLGHGSELKYSVDKRNQRVVDLDGVAFFNVIHNEKQPFIVKTPAKLNIQVLGTKFNVSAYAEDNTYEVVLEQGRVRLKLKDRDIGDLVPNERVIYQPGNNTIEKSKVNVHDYLAWKDGKLILNDVSLKEACLKLGRFYNIEFELQTKDLDKQTIRLILEEEPLEDALNLLTLISPIKYQIEERKMTGGNLYSKKKVIIKNK